MLVNLVTESIRVRVKLTAITSVTQFSANGHFVAAKTERPQLQFLSRVMH